MFSNRSALGDQENRLSRALRTIRAGGSAPIDLTRSNPTAVGFPPPPASIGQLAAAGSAPYRPEAFGLPEARAAVAQLMSARGPNVSPEHVILTASTSEAYAFLLKLLCDPGDEMLVPAPSYPLFAHLLQLEGVHQTPYPLVYDGYWQIDQEALVAKCGPRTRGVMALHPNNPTGSYLRRHELATLSSLGVPLISDEVFESYALERGSDVADTAREASQGLVFTLHGLSKLAGLPQLKLSWICVGGPDPQVREAMARLEVIADAFLSVSTPAQQALPEILESHGVMRDAIHARLRHNHGLLRTACEGTPASLLRVEGGWYAVLRVPGIMDDERWALNLLEHVSVLVQPGYFYDFEGPPHLIISLLVPEDEFAIGVQRMIDHILSAC